MRIIKKYVNYMPGTVQNPIGIAYDTTNNRIAIVEYASKRLRIYRYSDLTLIESINLPSDIVGSGAIAYNSINNYYLIGEDGGLGGSARVYKIDANNYTITGPIISGYKTIRGFVFDNLNDRLYISSYDSNIILILRLSDLSVITTINCNKACGITVDFQNNLLYVACHTDACIRVFSTITYQLISTITGSGSLAMSLCYDITQDESDPTNFIISDYNLNSLFLYNSVSNSILGKLSGTTTCRFSIFIDGKIYTTLATNNKVSIINKFY